MSLIRAHIGLTDQRPSPWPPCRQTKPADLAAPLFARLSHAEDRGDAEGAGKHEFPSPRCGRGVRGEENSKKFHPYEPLGDSGGFVVGGETGGGGGPVGSTTHSTVVSSVANAGRP